MGTQAPVLGEPLPVELMNTIWADSDGVHDALATADEAAAWLATIATRADVGSAEPLRRHGPGHRTAREAATAASRRPAPPGRRGDRGPRPDASSPVADMDAAVVEVNRAAAASPRWWTLNSTLGAPPSRTAHAAKAPPYALVSQIAEDAVALFATPSSHSCAPA